MRRSFEGYKVEIEVTFTLAVLADEHKKGKCSL